MSALLRIHCGRDYHTIVVDDVCRWHVSYGYSYTSTTVHFRDGTNVVLDGNHDSELAEAIEQRKSAPSG